MCGVDQHKVWQGAEEEHRVFPEKKDGVAGTQAGAARIYCCPLEHAASCTRHARADLVSQVPGTRHITDTDSGHYIHQEQPQLVFGSVREVVEAVRKKACALGTKNHGQCIKALKHARR